MHDLASECLNSQQAIEMYLYNISGPASLAAEWRMSASLLPTYTSSED